MDEPTRMPPPCLFTVTQLLMAWTLLREGHISLKEFRVYFALAVLRSGRRRAKDEAAPKFDFRTLRALVGGGDGERPAVEKLLAVGLLGEVSATSIAFATDPRELHVVAESLGATLAHLSQKRQVIAVPRPIARVIARGARRTLIATILGHLIHRLKRDASDSEGYVKASWIAQVFGLSRRAVKEQRQHLVALGWLLPRPTSQRTLNIHGCLFAINLGWNGKPMPQRSLAMPSAQEPSAAPVPLLG